MRASMDTEGTRLRRTEESRVPRWLRPILELPLEGKLLGANLIIVGVAVLLLFGPVHLWPSRVVDVYVVLSVLLLGALVNSALVRLALGPLKSIERVAKRVSQGRNDVRVPTSMVADPDLRQLSTTLNGMLDALMADRVRMETLGIEAAGAERLLVAQELHDSVSQKLAAATLLISAVAIEMGKHAPASQLAELDKLLRSATRDIRNVSRASYLHLVTDAGLPVIERADTPVAAARHA